MRVDRTAGKADLPQPQPLPSQGQQSSQVFEPLLRVEEAATLLGGMHPKTLMRLARVGDVPAIKIGRCWFFRASALNAWVDVQSQPHRPCHTERLM
jgi:excisionase family DNA binding protein